MAKLGKILAPIIAVLAIASVTLSVFLFKFINLDKERSSKIAKEFAETAKKLDAGTSTGDASKVTFTPSAPGQKETGTLSFHDFKLNKDGFSQVVGAVPALADTVVTQRNDMSDAISEITSSFGLNADYMSVDDLRKKSSYEGKLKLAKSYFEAFKKRDDELAAGLKQCAQTAGAISVGSFGNIPTVSDDDGEEQVTFAGNADAIKKLNTFIGELNKRCAKYESTIKNLNNVIRAHKFTAPLGKISKDNYESVLSALVKDAEAINSKLLELDKVKKQLEDAKAEIRRNEEDITNLKEKLKQKQEDLDAKEKIIRDHGIEQVVDNRPDINSIDDVLPDTKGKVIRENKDWNYVIINLGKKEVAIGTEVVISSIKGEYLASGKVTKVEDYISMVEIIRRSRKSDGDVIPKGSTVYMGKNVGASDNSDLEED